VIKKKQKIIINKKTKIGNLEARKQFCLQSLSEYSQKFSDRKNDRCVLPPILKILYECH